MAVSRLDDLRLPLAKIGDQTDHPFLEWLAVVLLHLDADRVAGVTTWPRTVQSTPLDETEGVEEATDRQFRSFISGTSRAATCSLVGWRAAPRGRRLGDGAGRGRSVFHADEQCSTGGVPEMPYSHDRSTCAVQICENLARDTPAVKVKMSLLDVEAVLCTTAVQ